MRADAFCDAVRDVRGRRREGRASLGAQVEEAVWGVVLGVVAGRHIVHPGSGRQVPEP